MVDSAYFVKFLSTPLRTFTGSFQNFGDMFDILQICMKIFDADFFFFFFLDKVAWFLT